MPSLLRDFLHKCLTVNAELSQIDDASQLGLSSALQSVIEFFLAWVVCETTVFKRSKFVFCVHITATGHHLFGHNARSDRGLRRQERFGSLER